MPSQESSIDLAKLRFASREPVINELASFAGIPVNAWLSPEHPAKTGQYLNASGKTLARFQDFMEKFSQQEIAQVLAATGPNHCMDGWTYLSRALAALLSGDAHVARHLAYYAQLRAGLSILCCNGIGITNTFNFVIDSSQKIHRLDTSKRSLGTHKAVWEVLQAWSNDPQIAKTFFESMKFRGVALSDCINGIWPSSLPTPMVAEVIESWGVDLKLAVDDRDSRNVSSYAVHALNPTNSNLSDRLKLVREIWLCLEPDGQGGFPDLDRHLLRKFLKILMTGQGSSTSMRPLSPQQFSRLDPRIQKFVSLKFLNFEETPEDLIVFDYAFRNSGGDVHAMICRALLLLRVATSIVRSAFVDAAFEPLSENVQPWFELIGIAKGFWFQDQQPEEIADLWEVIKHSVSDLDELISSNHYDQRKFLDLLSSQSVFLSQTERACMWAVCP